MLDLETVKERYLPYFGHVLMAIGYVLEQFETVGPPVPSGVVVLGHLCVLTNPDSLPPERPIIQVINLLFFISNIVTFINDVIRVCSNNVAQVPPTN